MRSLLPWHHFALETSWSPPDVARELRQLLHERTGPQQVDQAHYGAVDTEAFRLVWGKSGIGRGIVMISGRVQQTLAGSRVDISVRLPVGALLILFVGVPLLALLSAVTSIAALVRHEGIVLLVWIMPFAICNGILQAFRRDALAGEAFFRTFFPTVPPPSEGPFR